MELIEDNIGEDEIDEKESYYIELYNTFYNNGKGYNMTSGGQGIHDYQHIEETKAKMGNSIREHWLDLKYNNPEEYERQCKIRSEHHSGWKPSEETLRRMSEAAKKKIGELNSFYGKHHSDETKKRLSDAKSLFPIAMYDLEDNFIMKFKSCKEASIYVFNHKEDFINVEASKPSVLASRIRIVVKGKNKTAYGRKWKYI